MSAPDPFGLGLQIGTRADVFADHPEGRHTKLVTRVCDTPADLFPPELRARVERRRCSRCDALCWWDPVASVYPAGEVLVCEHCVVCDPSQALRVTRDALATLPPEVAARLQRKRSL